MLGGMDQEKTHIPAHQLTQWSRPLRKMGLGIPCGEELVLP